MMKPAWAVQRTSRSHPSTHHMQRTQTLSCTQICVADSSVGEPLPNKKTTKNILKEQTRQPDKIMVLKVYCQTKVYPIWESQFGQSEGPEAWCIWLEFGCGRWPEVRVKPFFIYSFFLINIRIIKQQFSNDVFINMNWLCVRFLILNLDIITKEDTLNNDNTITIICIMIEPTWLSSSFALTIWSHERSVVTNLLCHYIYYTTCTKHTALNLKRSLESWTL